MDDKLRDIEDILEYGISGYHRYIFSDQMHLQYASQNLCDMLKADRQVLVRKDIDGYAEFVYPADVCIYNAFIEKLRQKEQTLSEDYRLVRRDGTVMYVHDSVTTRRQKDNILIGDSVLSDVTDLKMENQNLKFLNETVPCGMLRYTCEQQPHITYMNEQMSRILRIPERKTAEKEDSALYYDNIYMLIPMGEHRRFASYLKRVYEAGTPIAGEVMINRCDGTNAFLFGWVAKCVNEQGQEEFQSVCMDITSRYQSRRQTESQQYLQALMDVYDMIFKYDLSTNMVQCLYSNHSARFQWLENIPMQIQDATEKWIRDIVVPEDRDQLSQMFWELTQKRLYEKDEKPPRISYRAESSDGKIRQYNGIFLRMDDSVSLYCCRKVPDVEETSQLRDENVHLKENMQELVMRFTDGIAAFEVTAAGNVLPMYSSDNICRFFGYDRNEWMILMEKGTPLAEFVSRSGIDVSVFEELLRIGEAEFPYYDIDTQSEHRMKAICSLKYPSRDTSRYVMLYKVDETKETEAVVDYRAVSIRTFGYFDVFVGDRAVVFRNEKAKELFALLVDRRGGYITSKEAIGFLWEDEPDSPVMLARYRKVALRLKNTLEEYGIRDVIEAVDGRRRIVPEKVRCDLFDYLSGDEQYSRLFKGSYLTNYSWGEKTLAELTGTLTFL